MNSSQPKAKPAIRIAVPSDVESIVRVTNRAYGVENFCLQGDRTDAADVTTRMQTGQFLVIDAPKPLAALGALVYMSIDTDRGYLGTLSVDPTCQGLGLAKALVTAVEHQCRRDGCRFLDLNVVNLRKELFPFYAKLGFAPIAVLPFPRPEKMLMPVHLIQMTKPLYATEDL